MYSPPPPLQITKVSEETCSSSSVHLNIFFCHLLGGACPQGFESCLHPTSESIGHQLESALLHGPAPKINYCVEVRGENKGQSISVRVSGRHHGAAGKCCSNDIDHRDGPYINTRSETQHAGPVPQKDSGRPLVHLYYRCIDLRTPSTQLTCQHSGGRQSWVRALTACYHSWLTDECQLRKLQKSRGHLLAVMDLALVPLPT